jgi:hypothetical protein
MQNSELYKNLFKFDHPAICPEWNNAPLEIKRNALIHYYFNLTKDYDKTVEHVKFLLQENN